MAYDEQDGLDAARRVLPAQNPGPEVALDHRVHGLDHGTLAIRQRGPRAHRAHEHGRLLAEEAEVLAAVGRDGTDGDRVVRPQLVVYRLPQRLAVVRLVRDDEARPAAVLGHRRDHHGGVRGVPAVPVRAADVGNDHQALGPYAEGQLAERTRRPDAEVLQPPFVVRRAVEIRQARAVHGDGVLVRAEPAQDTRDHVQMGQVHR